MQEQIHIFFTPWEQSNTNGQNPHEETTSPRKNDPTWEQIGSTDRSRGIKNNNIMERFAYSLASLIFTTPQPRGNSPHKYHVMHCPIKVAPIHTNAVEHKPHTVYYFSCPVSSSSISSRAFFAMPPTNQSTAAVTPTPATVRGDNRSDKSVI